MSWLENKKCDKDKCLRKFKSEVTGLSEWCGVVGDKSLEMIKPSSKECPLYCDKFFCYQTRKIVKKHEDTYWINDDPIKDDYRELYGLKAKDVKFSGLSKKGQDKSDKEFKFRNAHHDTSHIVCPHCDFEIVEWWECVDSDNDFDEVECPDCEREFGVEINKSISFTTRIPEDREDA